MTKTALDGIVVVDFSRILAGPLVGMTLGDLGADVIKVEAPGGDDTRRWQPPTDAQGRASYHHAANRNKRSIALDLNVAPDLELARQLCERADVVVSNFKPGTLERFGLDYGRIVGANPQVVYCEVSGFGERGGYDLPGYDPLVQAVGGLMSITGPPGAPSKAGVAIVDIVTALYATVAVLAALYARRELGKGQRITIDLLHANLAMLANQSAGWLASGRVPEALGNVHPSIEPFATYRAGDGDLMILAGNDGQFVRLVTALGIPELATDERFSTNEQRVANRDELRDTLEGRLGTGTRGDWRDVLLEAGVPAGPVQTIDEAFSLAAELGLDAVDEIDGVRTVSFPAHLSETPATVRRRPPDLDEHAADFR
ncbi:MAG TPA: CoA transferase [Gaiellaceae bacterium]|jgi:crotonobetainyl-CoA:carnitine CoA-transferase CaiB-like acyl-CoA transferase|nr:CoA transferase [Gaiellaceae bacterium]